MIKKPTLILLLCAIALGGGVYYYNQRQSKVTPTTDTSKPALTLQASDVTVLVISHPSKPDQAAIRFEKSKDDWRVTQPVDTEADQSSVQGIVDQLAGARVTQ